MKRVTLCLLLSLTAMQIEAGGEPYFIPYDRDAYLGHGGYLPEGPNNLGMVMPDGYFMPNDRNAYYGNGGYLDGPNRLGIMLPDAELDLRTQNQAWQRQFRRNLEADRIKSEAARQSRQADWDQWSVELRRKGIQETKAFEMKLKRQIEDAERGMREMERAPTPR